MMGKVWTTKELIDDEVLAEKAYSHDEKRVWLMNFAGHFNCFEASGFFGVFVGVFTVESREGAEHFINYEDCLIHG